MIYTPLDIVALVCNNTGIPHIEFDVADEEHLEEKPNHQMTLNLYPSQLILSKAYADIVQNLGWRKFTVVYDAEDSKLICLRLLQLSLRFLF